MTAFDGSGALGMLGVNPIPQGTPDELRKEGANLELIASCAPRSPGVRGCAVWAECPFNLLALGGFKGQGRKYLGYYLRTHEGAQQQGILACDAFVRTMLGRMRAGSAAEQEGKPHETVRIIAMEEGSVARKPDGTPWPTTITRRGGQPVDPNNHNINAAYRMVTETVPVPRMPRPGENQQSTFDQIMWTEEKLRRASDPMFQTGLPPDAEIPDADETFATGSDETVLEFDPSTKVAAEPIGKGKK